MRASVQAKDIFHLYYATGEEANERARVYFFINKRFDHTNNSNSIQETYVH
jgi:hypothetical protein